MTRRGYAADRQSVGGIAGITGARLARVVRCVTLGVAVGMLPVTAALADEDAFLANAIVTSTVPANGDLNPYGVAIVPDRFPGGGALHPGDVLVSNFNNSNNNQGTGTTIIKFSPGTGKVAPNGQAIAFFQGKAGLGLTTALGVLQRGFVLVGNVPTTNGMFTTIQPGSLLFLDRNGEQILAVTTPLNGPWDLTIFDEFDHAKVFVSNVLNGTVARLDLVVGASAITVAQVTTIATGYTFRSDPNALVLGPTGLAYDAVKDVLYVASTADNAIFAVPRAGTAKTAVKKGTPVFLDPHLRGPLALAFAPNGDLLSANGDAVNADPTQPSEIVEFTREGKFVSQFNIDAAQGGAFGLAVAVVRQSFVRFAFVDDVNNTLTVLDRSTDRDSN